MKRLILAIILPTLAFIAQSGASEKREEPQPRLVFDLRDSSSGDESSQDETDRTQHVTLRKEKPDWPSQLTAAIAKLTHENEQLTKQVGTLSEALKTAENNDALCAEQWSKSCLLNYTLENELTKAQEEIKRLRTLANKATEGKIAPKSAQAPRRARAVPQRKKNAANAAQEESSDAIADEIVANFINNARVKSGPLPAPRN
ncbi:hypothetical protein JST99_03260 [Candidatus Dependentiae bacterium]|nr:hypothetical protein [Candidatus Dependentiae bacterium]